ncbi:MAG: response regulator transcription factor [Sporocytophaga sp.]|uniref:LytR/AlgR family response regulator transcription factor n=1 Tax=Sporocytophaga sp. TaxID=2231183 RepID=UPI001B1EC830|nr:LytTR family DNA-binding domain-containing protein [Sporocytophaga sp.]MBO9701930.1 response regulator transcription factor [Sporocytophaga sp.]
MFGAIIVDDELKSRESLKSLLTTFCEDIEVLATCKNVEEGLEAINRFKPEVVFLDIQMKGETSFDLLAQLSTIDFDIIFTTAHSEYAIKAIKFSALDYLLKPIDIDELQNAVSKIKSKKNDNALERIHLLLQNMKTGTPEKYNLAIPTQKGLIFIKVNEILYFQASGNYTEIFMTDGQKYITSRHLKEYDTYLSEQCFYRIHHSYLININFIKEYVRGDGGYVIMNDGTSLDVSKRKKDAFLERIGYKV